MQPEDPATIPVPKRWWLLPLLLLAADLVLMGIHFAGHYVPALRHPRLMVSTDWSYGEMLQYVKELAIAAAFVVLYARRHAGILLVWAALFVFLLADDALSLHENAGAMIRRGLDLPSMFGLRGQDFGELAAVAPIGLLFAGLLFVTFRRSDTLARSLSLATLILTGVLAGFGIVGDMLHSAIQVHRWFFALLEDGGEMLAMTAIATLVYAELRRVPWRRWLATSPLAAKAPPPLRRLIAALSGGGTEGSPLTSAGKP
ncbi:MAG: hypothetical protein AAFX58_03145 [Pseudomonadota bacterium]